MRECQRASCGEKEGVSCCFDGCLPWTCGNKKPQQQGEIIFGLEAFQHGELFPGMFPEFGCETTHADPYPCPLTR